MKSYYYYYYTDGKTNYGPFTTEELKGKNLTGEVFIWTDSFPEWKKLKDIPELKDVMGTVPPPFRNEQKSSRKFVDMLLIGALVFWLIDSLILRLVPWICSMLNVDYFRYYPYLQMILGILFAAVPVIVACSVQNKILRIIALIISVIIAIIAIAGGIAVFIQMQKYSNY